MPEISYQLTARSTLAQTITETSTAMRGMAGAAETSYKQLVSGLNASTRAAAEMRKEIVAGEGAAKSSATAHDNLFKTIAGGTAVGTLAANALLAVGGALLSVGKGALENAANLQTSKIAFTQLLGSAQAASKEISDLQAFSAKTPFNFADVRNYTQQLIGTGTAAKEVIPVLTDLGNATAAVGGGNEKLQRIVLAYEQIQAKGKLAGDEAKQLAEAGIPVWQLLATQLHTTTAQIQQLSTEGKITADVFDKAFHAEAVARWGGQMDAASHSAQGIASNLQDTWEILSAKLAGPTLEVIGKELGNLVDTLSDPKVATTLDEWGVNLGKAANAAAVLWDNVSTGARAAFQTVKPVFDAIGQLLGGLPNAPAAPDLTPAIKSATGATTDLSLATGLAATHAADYKTEIQGAQDVLEGMKRTQAAQDYALQGSIDAEKRKLTVLEAQWAGADKATGIARLQQKIAQDEALGKNLYSSAGASARERLVGERQQLEDAQTAAARDGVKARMTHEVQGLEDTKKARDHAATLAQQAQGDIVQAWQRRAATEKAEFDKRAAQYTADQAAQTAAEAAKQVALQATLDKAKSLYHFFGFATAPFVATIAKQTTGLDGMKGTLGDLFTEAGKVAGVFQGDVQDSFNAAGTALHNLWQTGDDLAKLFGEKGGLGGAMADTWKVNMGIMVIAADSFTQQMRTLALVSAIARGDFAQTSSLLTDVFKHTPGYDIAVGLGNKLDQALGTTGKPGATGLLAPGPARDLPVIGAGDILDRGADNPGRDQSGRLYPLAGGRDSGGPVRAGGAYLIGGKPEIFIPAQSGYVHPAAASGAGGSMGVTVTHLCPACLQTQIEDTILRRGDLVSTAAGRYTRATRHI